MQVMDPNIELHLLNYRLKIFSIKKNVLYKLIYPLMKICFTDKTKCSFVSFIETNDDYSIVVDNHGFNEISKYLNESEMTLSRSNWIPMYICGDDLPGQCSISKIAKYIILPLAEFKISIMAISMYQCDYILVQDKDYDKVVNCLSKHIPKIYDESLPPESELIYVRTKSSRQTNGSKRSAIKVNLIPENERKSFEDKSLDEDDIDQRQLQITLPLLIPDNIEYCITGLYNLDTFYLIIPTLIDIMFFETDGYSNNEIFFNFTKKEADISIVIETRLLKKFPSGTLLNTENDFWKLIRIGQLPIVLEVFGVCASISQPLELANIDEYYISSFHTGYCFIPSDKLDVAKEAFAKNEAQFIESTRVENLSIDPFNGTFNENNETYSTINCNISPTLKSH